MPIQRDLYSPESDYQFFSKLNDIHPTSNSSQHHQKLTLYTRSNTNNSTNHQQNQQQQQQQHSEIENINEIRKLIREQTLLKSNVKLRVHTTNSDESDELEVPIRRFTPLPDIPRSDEPYFRTESRLIKTEIKCDNITLTKQNTSLGFDTQTTTTTTTTPVTTNSPHQQHQQQQQNSSSSYCFDNLNTQSLNEFSKYNRATNKETRYHFASSTTTSGSMPPSKKLNNHRLPALEKIITHTIQNTMDLDEDLPMNPEPIQNQRGIYTSPGDRIISPIKRPQAPSPLSSSLAYRRKANQKSDSDSDSDQTIN